MSEEQMTSFTNVTQHNKDVYSAFALLMAVQFALGNRNELFTFSIHIRNDKAMKVQPVQKH